MSKRAQVEGELNLTRLAEAVAAEQGVGVDRAQAFVQSVLDVIGRAVAEGHRVKLTNFATFEPSTHTMAAGALGGRVAVPTVVRTVRFRLNGKLHDAVRQHRPVTTLRKSSKTPASV